MKKLLLVFILLSQCWVTALADSFVVRNIVVEGLERTTPATVESYLPIKRGQTLYPDKTAAVLRSLYQTGFFDHVSISRDGHTLIIKVVERPTIGQLKITGNSVIPTDKLSAVLKSLEVVEGRVYNPVILEKIKQSLLNQYYQLGRYNARVDISSTPLGRNRVLVKIAISEGLVAKVRKITIIGNHVFKESTLIDQLELSTSGVFSFISQTDRYSEEKLEMSLEKLRSYYMDRGYIRYEVLSSQAEITPDRKSVYVTIVISEGAPYTVKAVELEGKLVLPRAELEKQIVAKPGDTFSRQKVIDSEKSITKLLGSKGYMFSTISIRPQVSDQHHNVVLIFDINSGKRVYVRHVTFSDNTRTNDDVLRREILQMESAPASTTQLDASKHRLSLLPYIRDVEMTVKPVPGTHDQVDVNYKVKEDSSAQATFKVGYSQIERVILGLSFNQKNFFGTGNSFGINLMHSKFEQVYSMDYSNPYYTQDGISRTFSLSASRFNPRGAGLNNGYTTHEYDFGVLYGIPLGQEEGVLNRLQAGLGYQNTIVYLIPGDVSNQINAFVDDHGTHFQQLDMKVGVTRDSRDKAMFPTKGINQNLFFDFYAPVAAGSVSFYTMSYHAKWYQPLYEQFILLSKGELGYGNGFHGPSDFPFFRNYYTGGINSVRGYQGYTLGPRDSNGKAFGGNMLATASVGLIFPNYLSDNLRTSAFFDAGNVYSIKNNRDFGCSSTNCSSNAGPIRYSAGVEADWLTPFGPIQLSLARALNIQPHDQVEAFQFAMGANF